ncbi:methyltransferase domain-containing protein [Dyella solisilvae]|uniref:Methyltransferase domain-containing protein n=1 Tax=Dyella solisilvae TaxID=1920168 RepID=A0A370K489_9GAMM|nr:methyltransferase domain-containing protein [Dyella solisilvae]RDI97459.1 methyltransferase domain-containing protein [Dyella solisilvae]
MPGASTESRILDAWQANADAWTGAVRNGCIESRQLVTDRAIVDAVLAQSPRRVIDLGCGEGWLTRALADAGIAVIGVDAVPSLIEAARADGGGDFRVLSYAELTAGALRERADVVVCNFSLLGEDSVAGVLAAVPSLLEAGGVLIVQTLHPLVATGDKPYRDGWREGSWAGCGEGFAEPAPWYFRTMGGWLAAFAKAGLHLKGMLEPIHPHTGRPASVIFLAGES